MSQFLVLFVAFFLGFICKRISRFPPTTGLSVNLLVIYMALPSMILARFPELLSKVELAGDWWMPVGMAWVHFLLAFFAVSFFGERWKWSPAKTGALILTVGLGNSSFVGFPILDALIGKSAIEVGILADQPGFFLILGTLGILVAAIKGGHHLTPLQLIKRLFLFPPFLAMLVSCFWFFTGYMGEPIFHPLFERLSLTLIPLALFGVGFQTQWSLGILKKRWRPLALGLSLKLFVLPMFFYILVYRILGKSDLYAQVTLLESAMATQIASAVIVQEFNLDSELANLMVSLSVPLSLLTVPLWFHFITSG